MQGLFHTWSAVTEIAFRNLLASRWKTAIVGGIIGFGALLVVVGSALLNAIDHSMGRSITDSIAGHIQVYSAESKDDVEIMGGIVGEAPNLTPLDDFGALRTLLLAVANVADVVPMGLSLGFASSGNIVDQTLASLRLTTDARQRGDTGSELARRYEAQKAHIRQTLTVLRNELENAKRVTARAHLDQIADLDRAASDAFWDSFDSDPFAHLEFLENRVAALAPDSDAVPLRYVGTDPQAFARAFDRMQVVDGESIPSGKRGFMFTKFVYEEEIKLKVARGLDKLKTGIDERHNKIANDPNLKRIVRENTTGVRELLLQLDAVKTERFRHKLQNFLRSTESDVGKLLALFFATDDANFQDRYRFFYAALAPEVELYRVRIGDTLTVQAYSRGYIRSVNLKVYGTYAFKGLEKSPQAGLTNMMDLVSFRELSGFMTSDRKRELEAMRAAAGANEVSRENAEAELFGSKLASHDAAAVAIGSEDPLAELRGIRSRQEAIALASYDPKQLEEGVVLNAAVMVKDESKIPETLRAIERAGTGVGLRLKAVPWQKAAGFLGQFATLMRVVLYAAVLIIFVVALVVINNALVMATLARVREIGTLRAIGAQRRFILAMLVLEAIAIGISSGALGASLGGLLLAVLGKTGIPAANEAMTFTFSGPRLFPSVSLAEFSFALVTVLVVSVVSSVYPAWLAMHVSPREAMQTEE